MPNKLSYFGVEFKKSRKRRALDVLLSNEHQIWRIGKVVSIGRSRAKWLMRGWDVCMFNFNSILKSIVVMD